MATDPKTVPEWEAYIATLEGDELYDNAERANSITFVRALKAEGLSPKDIQAIFEAFVKHLDDQGELPPAGGYFDLRQLKK